jgi:serine kinase of HPr protein (carbohydrate metabolism regulator)
MIIFFHASCVAIGGRAVLIGDDGILLEPRGGRVVARPHPRTAGKLEVRNLGLIELPATDAPLALVIRLDPDAPRFIEAAESLTLCGLALPLVRLDPRSPVLHLTAERALIRYGLAE